MEGEDQENNSGRRQRFNKKRTSNPAKASSTLNSSEEGTSTLLKAKGKITKKPWSSRLETPTPHLIVRGGEGSTKNVNVEDNKLSKNSDEQNPENNHLIGKNEERGGASTLLKAKGKILKESQASKLKMKKKPWINKGQRESGANEMNTGEESKQKNPIDELLPKNSIALSQSDKGNALELHKGQQKQNKEKYLRFHKDNEREEESHDGKMKAQTSETAKERVGGLIFMCNGKTKPDCFHYRIMGVTNKNKDIVSRVKPGIKLFLYDFDLKMLYGIYSASSCGGMKLEPKAFGGAFPAQVRFNIDKDCFPLPESIFKKAITENYDEKKRFKTELTVKQVRKLIQLFRPVGIHSLQPAPSPQALSIPKTEIRAQNLLVPKTEIRGVQVPQANSRRDSLVPDHHDHAILNTNNVLSHSSDVGVSNNTRLAWREEIPHDLFITEKEYRLYSLNGKGKNVIPYSSVDPAQPETRQSDLFHLNDMEYRAYVHGFPAPHNLPASIGVVGQTPVSSFTNNHHYADHYGTSSAETLLHCSRQEITSSSLVSAGGRRLAETDNHGRKVTVQDSLYPAYNNLGRNETVQDRLYLTYAADPLIDYNRTPLRSRTQQPATLPVSSRYKFTGPSKLYL